MQLLHHYFPELKELKTIRSEEVKTVFIFDGLDECRLPLNFRSNEMCCDLTKNISVDVLLTNLIQGNLLPSALLWITSRPAATNQIPPECVDQVTEVRGFNDSEKEEYFRKRFGDRDLAEKIIAHIKSSRSLHIMCHIPVFCWISATVLEKTLGKSDMEVPKTLTQMYTHFLLIQTYLKNKKYHGVIQDNTDLPESDKEMIFKLAKLAFLQLEKENLIFYENDLTECDIDVSKATEYSAICTEIFKEEFGLYREKVFCFVHLSIQEHLAAVYVQLKFTDSHINILQEDTENQNKMVKMSDLHKSAVDRALKSKNGHFDLFLRFLLGLSLDSNQALLRGLLPKPCLESLEETVDYIKEKIRKESSAERTINLFHCLNELNYNSLVEEIHSFLRSGKQSETELKPDQCSALAYVLLTSEDVMDEFDLKMCNTSPEGYRRLLPVVKTSRRARLAGVNLTDESCETLASILQSASSHLVELDLSFNSLGDLGVKLLCTGISNPHSKLEKLTLSHNELEHIGVKLLCDCLQSPHCKLQTLGVEIERPHSPSPSYVSVEGDKSVELNQDDGETFPCLHPSATVPAKYTPQEPKLCQQHHKPLEIYCKTDETLICKQCATVQHRGHNKSYTQAARALLELDTLSLLEQTLNNVDTNKFMWYLCQNYPECFETPQVTCDIQEASKLILERFGSVAAPKIALKVMLELGKSHKTIQDHLKSKLQGHLRSKFQCIREGNAHQGNPILLNDIFTELLITEGGDGAINKEHEIRQIEDACKNKGMEEIVIKCNDIFQPLPGQNKRIRTVLTKGIAGIGKTVSVHKFILDWAEGKANQDIHYIFPLPFRDLNLKGNDKYKCNEALRHRVAVETRLVCDLSDGERDGVDGGVSVKGEALEADLFEQIVQTRR
ncbi:hypothetical protein PDJAM_G00129870 [Pangasius djambal]|uniref:Uncharacterized protein n=1 Tax=Pangasius djambal TaxID=1691987 RepID=A0ACC5ZCB8_9TELE|nr:hypothetical protein [Pangasius djambal]